MRRGGLLFMGLTLVGLLVIAACGGSAPETVEFNLDIRDRTLEQESAVFRVKNGDTVVLFITSDEVGSIHVHGYDLDDELGPEGVTRMEFVANLEGRFALALHPGLSGGQTHSHDQSGSSGCTDFAALPEGSEPPTLQVTAQPGLEGGELTVGVALENFALSLMDTEDSVAAGHWHLYVDGELKGMYLQPEVDISGVSAGEHEIMVRLSDTDHCYYGIDTMTTVTLAEGSKDGETDHDGIDMDGEAMDHDSDDGVDEDGEGMGHDSDDGTDKDGEGTGHDMDEEAMSDGMDMNEDGQGTIAAPEETIIGFLEVLPR